MDTDDIIARLGFEANSQAILLKIFAQVNGVILFAIIADDAVETTLQVDKLHRAGCSRDQIFASSRAGRCQYQGHCQKQ